VIVHLVDGTYELFRHFYGLRRFNKGKDRPRGAVVGVLHTILEMIETGATHIGVATDHDSADGYPGIAGIGRATAARLVGRFGALEQFPESVLDGERREQALLFKRLATLRTDAPLFSDVEQLRWRGAGARFAEYAAQLDDARLLPRSQKAAAVSADQL